MEQKELFEDYEIASGWQLSPRIYQLLGVSVLVHVLALIIVSQFNLLQAKACDSPYIGKVCQVLDATYLGSILLGQDTGFTSQEYDPTQITEADQITYVDVSRNEPPLEYPAGYFAMTNPEGALTTMPSDFGSTADPMFPSSPSSPTTLDLNQPQILPTPNNDVASQPLPDSPFSFGDNKQTTVTPPPVKSARVPSYKPPRTTARVPATRQPKIKNESPAKLDDLGGETAKNNANTNSNTNQQVAKNDANNANKADTDPANEEDKNKFNQKPLKDFGKVYGEQILSKTIDINAPFTIEVIGKLDENGKLINPVMQAAPGSDPKMTEVAKRAIEAFIDSKLLRPIYEAGGRDVKITFAQNQDNLQAIIQTQAKNETDAKRLYNGVNIAMSLAKTLRKGSDEAILMEKAQLATQGKTFIINFLISNEEKTLMIEKSLKNLKQELEQQKTQPNSVAVNKNTNASS